MTLAGFLLLAALVSTEVAILFWVTGLYNKRFTKREQTDL